jgi:hypothetical protein
MGNRDPASAVQYGTLHPQQVQVFLNGGSLEPCNCRFPLCIYLFVCLLFLEINKLKKIYFSIQDYEQSLIPILKCKSIFRRTRNGSIKSEIQRGSFVHLFYLHLCGLVAGED